ncbi:MAG: hypothetical protein ACK5NI_02345 [bacterium]|jgi:hypothetical protein
MSTLEGRSPANQNPRYAGQNGSFLLNDAINVVGPGSANKLI